MERRRRRGRNHSFQDQSNGGAAHSTFRLGSMHSRRQFPAHGLYAITDGPRAHLLSACEAVLRGGATVLQYRDKSPDHARRCQEAVALVALCARFGVPLIINDDVELVASA